MLSPSYWNTIHIASSFCLIFLAFSVAQNFQTSSDHPSEGSIGLGILYGCFTLTNFVSAVIVARVGVKACLVIGALTYAIWVAANIYYYVYALYAASAVIGIGASLLWTSQGTYMTEAASIHELTYGLPTSSTLGMFNGVFWAIYQINGAVGNLIAAALFNANVSTTVIFVVMTAICGAGWVSLLFLRSNIPHSSSSSSTSTSDASYHLSNRVSDVDTYTRVRVTKQIQVQDTRQQIMDSLSLIVDPRMMFLLPCIMFSGLYQTYAFGEFPPLIEDKATKFYVLAVNGAVDMVASFCFGRLSDRYGRLPCLLIGGAANLSVMIYLTTATITQEAWIFYLCGFGLAIGDATFNTQIYAILGFFFTARAQHAFATFKLFQAGSTAIAFLIHSWVSFRVKSLYTIGFQVYGLLLLIICHVAYHPLEKKEGLKYQYQPTTQAEGDRDTDGVIQPGFRSTADDDDLYDDSHVAPTTPFHDETSPTHHT